MWKKEFLPPKIKLPLGFTRREGLLGFISGLFLVLFLAIILCANLQVESFRASSLYLEDALAASNLGAAMVDLREYGKSHQILVESPQESYRIFQKLLRKNLNLDENFYPAQGSVLGDKVEIRQFAVYNVETNKLVEHYFDRYGNVWVTDFPKGGFWAPNWQMVEYTSIYSEVQTKVKCFPGVYVNARKGKLVEVVIESVK